MAQRRMFSKEITTSDTFVDMPVSSRLLYFHLGMEADDEGFVGNARMLSRAYGANNDDLSLLKAKGFIITFENGVSVVKDWNVNNKIRKDRFKPTIYHSEKDLLSVDTTGSYYLVNQMTTSCQPSGNQMTTQGRLGKDRLGKASLVEVITPEPKENEKKNTEPTTKTAESSRVIFDFYEQNGFGILAPFTIEKITKWIDDFKEAGSAEPEKLIIKALEISVDSNIRNWGYAEAILKGWETKNLLTVKDVETSQASYRSKPKQTNSNGIQEDHPFTRDDDTYTKDYGF